MKSTRGTAVDIGRLVRMFGLVGSLVLILFLTSVSAASAAKGVVATFGKVGTAAGEFASNAPRDVAVNSEGKGVGGGVGDVYVADRGNNRIQRFDADGNFISAFGQDVVESGPGNLGNSYEICRAADGDVCKAGIVSVSTGGAMSGPRAIAVDQETGNVYVADGGFRRIQEFSAAGAFVRAWGQNVVKMGQPGDSPATSAKQTLTVTASAGKYTLEFENQKTAELSANVSAAEIQAALSGLSTIGTNNVEVSGAGPYAISFKGTHANNPEPDIVAASGAGDPLVGGTASVVTSVPGSNGFEICNTAADCQAPLANAATAGAFSAGGASISAIAIAPVGAPNAGDILVADASNRRVQEFTATGAFVRAFGWDIIAVGPGNDNTAPADEFEVCRVDTFDACRSGSDGDGVGQFSGIAGTAGPTSIAEDSSGTIYTVEATTGFRVQRFTLPGNVVMPTGLFDPDELSGTNRDTTSGTADYPVAVAVDTTTVPGAPGAVYVLKYEPSGSGSPPLATHEAKVLQVDPESEEVVDTFGRRAEIGSNVSGSATGVAFDSASSRLFVAEPSIARTYVVDEVAPIAASLGTIDVGPTTATLRATITPSPISLTTLYRFEYAEAGTGEWKSAPNADVDIGIGGSPVSVSQTIEGLQFEVIYEFRLVAHTRFYGAETILVGEPFTTQPLPPLVLTGEGRWSSPASTGPSLTLRGSVNPGSDQADFFFQYVTEEQFQATGFSSPSIAPKLPAPAGHGGTALEVLTSIAGLDPSKTYRYRLVAFNSVGAGVGVVRTVDLPDPSERFYELVSNAESYGNQILQAVAVSDDGSRVVLAAPALGDPGSLPAQSSPFIAERSRGGWGVLPTVPDPQHGESGIDLSYGDVWFPGDLSTALWSHYSPAGQIRGEYDWTFTAPDGALRPALPTLVPVAGHGTKFTYMKLSGAATNLSTFVFQREEASEPVNKVNAIYVPGQPLTTGEPGDIYRVSGTSSASPALSLVNRDSGGALISNSCGVWVGSRKFNSAPGSNQASKGMNLRPVSADGSVTYFSARPTGSPSCNEATNRIRIFKRIDDSATVEVSKAQCSPGGCSETDGDDFFQGASADGSRVFFTTTRQLVDADDDATSDLYLFDSSPPPGEPGLVQVSAKASVEAKVQESVVDISVDGSRVYFVAEGQLASGAVAGSKNLFVYQRDDTHPAGRLAFVAKFDSGDQSLWGSGIKPAFAMPFAGVGGAGAGDGHLLLFASKGKLVEADTDSAVDLYRFDDDGAGLACLTCVDNGNFDVKVLFHGSTSDPASPQHNRIASEDGSSVIFASSESLVGSDQNSVTDAYLWHQGSISLVSTGGPTSSGVNADVGASPMLSADGSSAYFQTTDRLLAADHDSARDVYAARVGGGFPEAEQISGCISADECRTVPAATPTKATLGSSSLTSSGNVTSSSSKCPRGKVRKHGRCVKKKRATAKKRHHRSALSRAGANQGGK